MAFEPRLRTDILTDEQTVDQDKVKVIAQTQFNFIVEHTLRGLSRTVTPNSSKNIIQVLELISQAINDYQLRTQVTEDAKIGVVYEKPDKEMEIETISLSFVDRRPGAFAQGKPFEASTQNRKPIFREEVDDPDHVGYKRVVLGYYYDNTIRLTAWARTNKAANERALWLETVMEEYSWFFTYSGVNRILFEGWRQNEIIEINGNKYYGRPIDYFVRTEKLWNVSQKTLEEIVVRLTSQIQ